MIGHPQYASEEHSIHTNHYKETVLSSLFINEIGLRKFIRHNEKQLYFFCLSGFESMLSREFFEFIRYFTIDPYLICYFHPQEEITVQYLCNFLIGILQISKYM